MPDVCARTRAPLAHPAFDMPNPSRVRLLGWRLRAPRTRPQFNRADGTGYDFSPKSWKASILKNPQLRAPDDGVPNMARALELRNAVRLARNRVARPGVILRPVARTSVTSRSARCGNPTKPPRQLAHYDPALGISR